MPNVNQPKRKLRPWSTSLVFQRSLPRIVSSGVQQLVSKQKYQINLETYANVSSIASQEKRMATLQSTHKTVTHTYRPQCLAGGMGWDGLGKLVLRMQQPPAERFPKTSKLEDFLRKQSERVQGTWKKKSELNTEVNIIGSRWGIPWK